MDGFQMAALMVVFVLLFGATLASIRVRLRPAHLTEPDPARADT